MTSEQLKTRNGRRLSRTSPPLSRLVNALFVTCPGSCPRAGWDKCQARQAKWQRSVVKSRSAENSRNRGSAFHSRQCTTGQRALPKALHRGGDFTVGTAARPEHLAEYMGAGFVVHAPGQGVRTGAKNARPSRY